jgi:hypothetical protein
MNLRAFACVFAAVSLHAQSSDRACLEGFVNQYLDAMIARNPSALPLSPKVTVTENEQTIPLGGGLWGTASGLGTYKLYVADPQAGEVGFLGTLRENGTPVALALRLRIENRLISIVETIVVRDPGAGQAVEALGLPDPLFLAPLPPAERRPRKEMIAIADKYYEGIEHSNGSVVPFDSQCDRVQNGVQTTNNPKLLLAPRDTWTPLSLGCKEQLDTKFFSFVQHIDPRRFSVIDEERGLVFGTFLFQVPGSVKSVDIPGHGTFAIPPPYLVPTTIDVAELYKIKSGKIRKVEALQTNIPYGTSHPLAAVKLSETLRATASARGTYQEYSQEQR